MKIIVKQRMLLLLFCIGSIVVISPDFRIIDHIAEINTIFNYLNDGGNN